MNATSESEEVQRVPEYEIVPGTIFIVDVAQKHTKLLHAGGDSSKIVLVPQPSDDPNDPLRWPVWKKTVFVAILWIYTFLLGGMTLGVSTVFVDVKEELETTPLVMSAGNAVQLFFLGLANVFLVPLTHKFGRRPVYFGTLIILLASQFLQMFMKTPGQMIGAFILSGLGAAPFDVLVEISFSDIFFAHQRGTAMSLYVLAASSGSFLGPLWQGFMASGMGNWRWIMRWGSIFCGIMLFLMFFFLEESLYYRKAGQREMDVTQVQAASEKGADANAAPDVTENVPIQPATLRSSLALWRNFPITWAVVQEKILAAVTSVTYPAVLWAGLFYGTIISWLVVMATTEAEFFFAPPYNFTSSGVGLLSIAPFVGTIIGLAVPGIINDKIVLALAARNGGYAEPEYRLWILIPVAFVQAAGLLIYGIAIAHGMHWMVACVGMACIAFSLLTGVGVLMSYVLDCYTGIAEEAITSILLIRGLFATGFTFAIQPWIEHSGIQNAFIAMAMLGFVGFLSAGIFLMWGKDFRMRTAKRYLRESLATQ